MSRPSETPSITSSPSWADSLTTEPLSALLDQLGHHFTDPAPLLLALTHRSWCAENAGSRSNERLEFLGDAVLGLIVTDHIFTAHPEMPEGSLAKLRAAVVSEPTLAAVAAELGVGACLRLGKGESASGGREKASILSDAMEAIIGAVYVDGGLDAARPVVLDLFGDRISIEAIGPGSADFKSQLQEILARRSEGAPVYELSDEGPDHDKRFFARVHVDGLVIGEGEGRSKKLAEQAAAQAAFMRLTSVPVPDGHRDDHQQNEQRHA
ncbi:MAG: ribonuclease III [Actinobacteria bacterium]|nr:ribonuclease III [Actinomycetota bacterium]